jgi:hypothetical protein
MNRCASITLLILLALAVAHLSHAVSLERFRNEFKIRRSLLTANHTGRRMFGQGESHSASNPSYLDTRNKLVIASDIAAANQSEPFVVNRSATNSPPFMVMIILVCVVLGIIVVISSALFVMRRRFYKWRLTLVSGSASSNSGETSEGDADEKTTEALVKEDSDKVEAKVDVVAVTTTADVAAATSDETQNLTEGSAVGECHQHPISDAANAVEAH